MTDTKQPEAQRIAYELERDAVNDLEHADVAISSYEHEIRKMSAALKTNAVNALRSQAARIAELEAQISASINVSASPVAWRYQTPTGWHATTDAAAANRVRAHHIVESLYAGAGGVTGLPDAQPFRSITWPKGREAGRMGDMTPLGESHMRVGFDSDNDVYVSVFNQACGAGDIEFCTYGQGGGKSPRTREALIALMVAMEEDSKETPSFRFPPGAAIAQEGGR
ncbi:hypothetical protein [Lampropedia aestuarii]|uniref:hypothetical protein n=1 Tax=Lampropedia aestuarii TaxID=2562762 RepID=UPI002468470E|nr:hypothetical protein [Lampropedia aestuarii]MDH5857763.1 hypothetical protein [Lampropedia aestuarii]